MLKFTTFLSISWNISYATNELEIIEFQFILPICVEYNIKTLKDIKKPTVIHNSMIDFYIKVNITGDP